MIDVIVKVTPPLIDALVLLILELLDAIERLVPKIIETAMVIINTILTTFVSNIPKFVDAGFKILIGFLKGIRDNIGQVVSVGLQIVTNFLNGIAANIGDVINAGFNLVISFINGMAAGIENNKDALNQAIGNLVKAIIDGLVEGILAGVGAVADAVWKLVQDGITGAFKDPEEGLDINSPSRVTRAFGQAIDEGLILGIQDLAGQVTKASENMAADTVKTMSSAISTVLDSLNTNMDSQPTIRPVLDLTDVVNGSKQINSMLAAKTFDMSATVNRLPVVPSKYESLSANPAIQEAPVIKQDIKLVQNNYSPKPLPVIEIYRNTKNQLNTFKGLVKNT